MWELTGLVIPVLQVEQAVKQRMHPEQSAGSNASQLPLVSITVYLLKVNNCFLTNLEYIIIMIIMINIVKYF
jgi:hypothetical protein